MSLFVTSQNTHSVLEFDEATGAFVKVAASGGALGDPLGVAIGLDGNVLVSDGQTNQVKRYNKATGLFIDVFASAGLSAPTGMTIHAGALYVTNEIRPWVCSASTLSRAPTPASCTLDPFSRPTRCESQPNKQPTLRPQLQQCLR